MKKILASSCFLVSFLMASAAPAVPLRVSLTTDVGGPGTEIDSVQLNFGVVPSIQSGASTSAPTLTAGQNYWVVVTALDPINDHLGWNRPRTIAPPSPIIAPVAQRVGTDPWILSNDYAGTLRITGADGTVLFDSFLAGNTYDTTSGWTIGGGLFNSNAGYSEAMKFTPTVSGTAQTLAIAAFCVSGIDCSSSPPTSVPEPGTLVLIFGGLAMLGWVGRRKKLKERAAA